MKKKIILVLMVIAVVFPLSLNNKVLATKPDEQPVVSKENLSKDLTVEILKDGRVAPIKKTEKLSEDKLDLILKKIGYPSNFITKWDINKKRQLASYGGKVVEGNVSDFKKEYVSSDGNTYEVTPFNTNEIKNIQLKDLKKIGITGSETEKFNLIEENKSLLANNTGVIQDGKWSANLVVSFVGGTSTQNRYIMMMEYFWDKEPQVHFGDSLGIYWGSYGNPAAGTAIGRHAINYAGTGNWMSFDHILDKSANEGITSQFGYSNEIYGPQMGFLTEEVWVSRSHINEHLTLSGAYIHPWVPGGWSMSVGYGGLSLNIPDNFGNKWTWRYNFMP